MQPQDLQSLDLLTTLHRIAAGIAGVCALVGVPFLLLGRFFSSLGVTPGDETPDPAFVGTWFATFGGIILALHFVLAVALLVAAGWLKGLRQYIPLLVLEILLLAWAPIGTALGIFGLVVLLSPRVRSMFS